MLEKAFKGGHVYWSWIGLLLLVIGAGSVNYLHQLEAGLGITGLSRDLSWGAYIAQFTFFVGVAASAVTVVLPYYLHDVREFRRITVMGELLAVAAVAICMLFIFVDMGQPARVLNVLLHPAPGSLMFWDMLSLSGYLIINAVCAYVILEARQSGRSVPPWIKPLVILSIPWAVSIHTVTAFLYSGLPGRPLWLTAALAPRFLASAFASGPALLILMALLLRRISNYDVGQGAIGKLAVITAYAMAANFFLLGVELFTALYSGRPEHAEPFALLYLGLEGNSTLVPLMWLSAFLGLAALAALLVPALRKNEKVLAAASLAVFFSLWLEKGAALIIAGFIPSPLGRVTGYLPTLPELAIVAGIWGLGALLLTVFYRIMTQVFGASDE